MTTNLGEQSTRFALPMFVIDGAEDNITPAVLARDYLDSVTAPRKDFTAIAGAGHLVPITHPGDFRRSLQEHVRPLLAKGD